MSEQQARSRIHLMVGAVIIGFGILLLLDQAGVFSVVRIYRFWPLILIALGLGKLFLGRAVMGHPQHDASQATSADMGKTLTFMPAQDWLIGVVLIIVGVNLQLFTLGYEHLSWKYVGPLIVILAGVAIIYWSLHDRGNEGAWSNAEINHVNFFGGGEYRVTSRNFRGGKLLNIFGGFKLDLTQASLQGDEAVMDLFAFFGGGEIMVPREWEVSIRGTALFGGYNDETRRTPREPGAAKKTLAITGIWIFGGLNVKN